jgi:hypothetical protein
MIWLERITSSLAVVLATTAVSSFAHADEVVTAQALFDQAKRAMAAHDYAEACPKLEASLKLQDALGTLLNLGLCYEHQGKLASAWSRFLEVSAKARAAGQNERARIGRERAAALAPKLSNLAVDVPQASRADGLDVRRDGVVVGPAEWGAAIPADAGEHTIEASAPGRKPWSQTVTVRDGAATARVTVPELSAWEPQPGPTNTAAPAAASPASPAEQLVSTDVSADVRPGGGGGLKVVALAAGGVGLAGLGVGAAFGLLSLSKHNEAEQHCPTSRGRTCQTQADAALWNDATSFGNVSTIAFVVGGVGLAAGVVFWLAAPKRAESRAPVAQLAVGPGSVALRGLW